jgi:hypothetical protein
MLNGYTILVLAPPVAGFLYGRLRNPDTHHGRHGLVLLGVVTFPFWIFVVANIFNSNAVGWLFGLSLIFGIPLLLLFFVGYGIGVLLNKKNRRRQVTEATSEPVQNRNLACVHINPVLDAMRSEGIEVRVDNSQYAIANCCLDLAELERRFGGHARDTYLERHEIDRSYLDPKSAFLHCDVCECWLTLVHPEERRDNTPWFPVANEGQRQPMAD